MAIVWSGPGSQIVHETNKELFMTPDTEQVPSFGIVEAPGTPAFGNLPFCLDEIRCWRANQALRGEPASLQDFFRVHDCCPDCFGTRQQCTPGKGAWYISGCPRCEGSGRCTARAARLNLPITS
jgi:hypothetical protein